MASRSLVFYTLAGLLSTSVIAHESVARETAARLPDVDAVLSMADETLEDFTAQAASMQDRVARAQNESAVELEEQKASYENNLTQQEADIKSMRAMNARIQDAIDGMQKTSAGITTETEALRGDNSIMHKALQVLEVKVKAAEEFLSDSWNHTNDAGADALKVLQSPTPEPTLVQFLSVLHDEPAASFLQLSKRSHLGRSESEEEPLTASKLEELLSDSLAEIAEEQEEGETQLRAQFLGIYEAGKKQQNELGAAQHALNDSRIVEERHESDLQAARDHVQETRADLLKRLHGMENLASSMEDVVADILGTVEATTLITEPHEVTSAGKLGVK